MMYAVPTLRGKEKRQGEYGAKCAILNGATGGPRSGTRASRTMSSFTCNAGDAVRRAAARGYISAGAGSCGSMEERSCHR